MSRPVRYVGGPLDGLELDTDGWTEAELRGGSEQILWLYRGAVSG